MPGAKGLPICRSTHPATSWKAGRFSGKDFALQPDGTLCCPAGKTLHPTEQRPEPDGSLRVLYAARIVDCRGCRLREQCQWHGPETIKPRRVSLLLHSLSVGSASLLWRDWSRRLHWRACMQLLRGQRLEVQMEPPLSANPDVSPSPLSRAQRAQLFLDFSHLLPFSLSIPLVLPSLVSGPSSSARLSPTR